MIFIPLQNWPALAPLPPEEALAPPWLLLLLQAPSASDMADSTTPNLSSGDKRCGRSFHVITQPPSVAKIRWVSRFRQAS